MIDEDDSRDSEVSYNYQEEVHSPIAPWLLTINHLDESDSSEGIHSTRHGQLARSPQSYLRQAGAFDYFKEPSDFSWFC